MFTIANREFWIQVILKMQNPKNCAHKNTPRGSCAIMLDKKILCGAIYYGIIHTCNHMNANGQNFHVALFIMRWEGIPTFTWEFDNIPRSLCCTHGNHVRYWNLLPSCHYSNLLQDLFYYMTPQKANSATTKTRGVSWTK